MLFAGDVSDVGGEAAQDGAEAGGPEAGPREDGHLRPVLRHQGHSILRSLFHPKLIILMG